MASLLLRQMALLLVLLVSLTSSRHHHQEHKKHQQHNGQQTAAVTTAKSHHQHQHHSGILMRSFSHLGEREIRVRYGRLKALESVIPAEGEEGLYYRQVSNGHIFIQAIYKGRENMVDCDMVRGNDPSDMTKFETSFDEKEKELRKSPLKNATIVHLDESSKRDDMVRHLLDIPTMKTVCRRLHRQQKHELKEKNRMTEKKEKAADAFNHLIGREVSKVQQKDSAIKEESQVQERGTSRHRAKRFIYPGTNWCGNGNEALDYSDLGDNVATDKCCRGHDHCPYTISGFSKKYHYINFRFHTLSHCHCDEIFRSCLRSAANNVADMVGQIYFNVVGTKCFTLSTIQTCANRSWWGSCIEYTDEHKAVLNDPFQY